MITSIWDIRTEFQTLGASDYIQLLGFKDDRHSSSRFRDKYSPVTKGN